jgi:Domain of unknown function (DUF6457)
LSLERPVESLGPKARSVEAHSPTDLLVPPALVASGRQNEAVARRYVRARERSAHMTAREWIDEFAARLGTPPPSEDDWNRILELAAEAAHSSERMAAPIACWLTSQSGRSLTEALEIAAGIASESATSGE